MGITLVDRMRGVGRGRNVSLGYSIMNKEFLGQTCKSCHRSIWSHPVSISLSLIPEYDKDCPYKYVDPY